VARYDSIWTPHRFMGQVGIPLSAAEAFFRASKCTSGSSAADLLEKASLSYVKAERVLPAAKMKLAACR
jgi:hypothetical protein